MPSTALKLNLQGKKAVVFGLGRSGLAAAQALQRAGAQVSVTDQKPAAELKDWPEKLAKLGIPLAAGGHPQELVESADLIVLSPGVPNQIAVLRAAQRKGIPRWSEIELAFRLSHGPWVAITGTNGKTTTTSLTAELFKQAGQPYLLGGNIGVALADRVADCDEKATIVAEVSSFQLEDIESFRPKVAVITNLTPDHLDRYPDMKGYAAAKGRIFENQGPEDNLVLNADDPSLEAYSHACRAQVLWFSRKKEVEQGAFVRDGQIILRMPGKEEKVVMAVADLGLRGPHNLENSLAALLAGAASNLPLAAMVQTLRVFQGVEHRLEPCGEVRGVRFINDSKGTNVDSVEKALQSFDKPIHLVLGGRDKEGDFKILAPLIRQNVKALYIIGEAASKIDKQVGELKPRFFVKDMADAVRKGFENAQAGEYVLLSPGCASFDMFQNYEHRGRVFKEEVAKLKKEVEG